MCSTGIFIIFLLVIGCSAGSTDPTDIAKKHVSAVLDAVEAKDQDAIQQLFNGSSYNPHKIPEFIRKMEGIDLNVESATIFKGESTIRAQIVLANMVSGYMELVKSPNSPTGQRIDMISFLKRIDPSDKRHYRMPRRWYCHNPLLDCMLRILNNWNLSGPMEITRHQINVLKKAVMQKNVTMVGSLFNSTEDDLKNVPKFIELFQGLEISAKGAERKREDQSIQAKILVEGKVQGSIVLKKSSASPTGYQFSSIQFQSNLNGRKKSAVDNTRGISMCWIGPLWCAIELLADWGIRSQG